MGHRLTLFFGRCYNLGMGMTLIMRRWAAWVACFAVLFAALAPSLSHAMAASQGDAWAEICTVGGAKLVKVSVASADAADFGQQDQQHLEHCPFCATHAGSFALLPGAGYVLPLLETYDTFPSLYFQSPRPLPIWTRAQSRAPPSAV